jgi:hypothetical protein
VLEREDGTPFRPSEADDHLLGIGTFLSFAAGAWAFPQLHVGLAADGSPAYRECGVRPVHPWDGRFRWFNDHDGASLERAFVSFDQLWARGEWREPLQKLIYLYVEANDRPPDVGLVLAQAALEQMAWHLLVNDRRVLSRGGFAKLSAADQLRRLVKTCVIPLDTPSALKTSGGREDAWHTGRRRTILDSSLTQRFRPPAARRSVRTNVWTDRRCMAAERLVPRAGPPVPDGLLGRIPLPVELRGGLPPALVVAAGPASSVSATRVPP